MVVAAVLVLIVLGGGLWADLVILKNGHTFRGKIIERRPTEIVLELPHARMTLSLAQIATIQEESEFERLVGQGRDAAAIGEFTKAIEFFRQALAEKPDAAGIREETLLAYRNAARKHIAALDVPAAEQALQALLAFAPGDQEATDALAELRRLRLQVDTIRDRAELLFDIGAYAQSIAEYRRVMALAPTQAAEVTSSLAMAHAEAGNSFFIQQRYPEAAVHFLQATRLLEGAGAAAPNKSGASTAQTRPTAAFTFRELRKRWAYSVLVPIINQINAGRIRDAAEWEAAETEVERVAAQAPDVAHVFFVLGLCREGQGDAAGALRAYGKVTGDAFAGTPSAERARAARDRAQKALQADPIRIMIATKDARWLAVDEGGWQTIASDHFVVFHRNAYVGRKVSRAAEYWYDAIFVHWSTPGADRPWPQKCHVYVYPTLAAFQEATGQPAWAWASTRVQAANGQLQSHSIATYQTVRLLNESVLPHEMVHVLLPQLLGYPESVPVSASEVGAATQPAGARRPFPRWIHEAAALLEEPDYKRYRYREAVKNFLADGVALTMPRIMAVRENPPEDEAQRFYAQCHAIGEFLLTRGGRRKFLEFAQNVVKGGSEKALLETYGFRSLTEFEQAWRAHARSQ